MCLGSRSARYGVLLPLSVMYREANWRLDQAATLKLCGADSEFWVIGLQSERAIWVPGIINYKEKRRGENAFKSLPFNEGKSPLKSNWDSLMYNYIRNRIKEKKR